MPKLRVMYAPVVRMRHDGRYVLLIGWRRRAARVWEARVVWLQRDGARPWKPVDHWVSAQEIEPVDGEDYRDVPREYYEAP